MKKQETWKWTKTKDRENAIQQFSEKLNEHNFSHLMDMILSLATSELSDKNQSRRSIQSAIDRFGHMRTDFVWRHNEE